MRTFFFVTLLLGSNCIQLKAQSCDDAYGMVTTANNDIYFASYNTLTNVQTLKHNFGPIRAWDNPVRKGFLNDSLKTYYCLTTNTTSYQTQLLYIDTETGALKSTIPLVVVHMLEYDTKTGKFYGIRWGDGGGGNVSFQDFICIDPETQTITSLYTFSPGLYSGSICCFIDPVLRRFYTWTSKDLGNQNIPVLMILDLNSGALLSDAIAPEFFTDIQYNKKDGKCYGTSTNNNGYFFSSFDPLTSSLHHFISLNIWPLMDDCAMINTEKDLFLYYGQDVTDPSPLQKDYLVSINIHNGQIVRTMKVREGTTSYTIYNIPMGAVWHQPSEGCTTTTDPDTDTTTHHHAVLSIPNLFTPNGDGSNESFEITNLQKGKASLSVYNTWGGLVYNSSSYNNNWNAEHNEDGIYYYNLTTHEDQKSYQGWVQVLR